MKAKTFVTLMLILLLFIGGLFVAAVPVQHGIQKNACPAGTPAPESDTQMQAGDGLLWQSVTRHLLSVVH